MAFPQRLLHHCNSILPHPIIDYQVLHGGDINTAYHLKTKAQDYFIKYNDVSFALDMFEKEALGLNLLREASLFKIPQIIQIGEIAPYAFLILEYIPSSNKSPAFWENFAKALVQLHQISANQFGLDHANYIGKLPQSNQAWDNWIDFYIHERLDFQVKLASNTQAIPAKMSDRFQRLYQRLKDLLPNEQPSLLHGDLWNGNFLIGKHQRAVLIDPAVYFGHREVDLAMSMLFGGFDRRFYEVYEYHYPLLAGFQERIAIYQLYYLLVNVNLFGKIYLNQLESLLKKYEKS